MLRFAEELLLLLLKEDVGDLAFVPETHLHRALAGAVLMDLALENRIDTDIDKLVLVDGTPVDDDLLDDALARVAAATETFDAEHWVREIAEDGEAIRSKALARLVRAGVLESAEDGSIEPSRQVARTRRYPAVDGTAEQEVRLRIMRVLFDDDLPGPRDVVIICLAAACGIFERMLTREELGEVRERIDMVGRLDLIGQAVTRAVRDSGPEAVAPAALPIERAPVVKGLPLLGSALDAAKNIQTFLTEQYLKLGPVFELRLMHRRVLVLAGPEANQFVTRRGHLHLTSYQAFRGFADSFRANRLVLSMDGPEHLRMRKALAPGLSRARLQENLAVASDTAHQHVAEWPLDQPINPLRALQGLIADQTGVVLAGTPAGAYLDALTFFLETVLTTVVTKQLPLFLFRRRLNRAAAELDELAEKTLAAHRAGGPFHDAGDFVNSLLDQHAADPQFMPETDIKALVLSPFLLGTETVANTCAFTLYNILKHPSLKERITAEADALFADGAPTAEGLRKLDVTHRVVLESMRLYSAAPVLFRTVTNSFEFAGYQIPAGKRLFFPFTVTHQLPEFFPEPERFDIDRYLPHRAEHRQRNVYAPFGLGTHNCIGGGFAEAQTLLTMAAILHAGDLVMHPPDHELRVTNVPTPRPAKSFKIKVKRHR